MAEVDRLATGGRRPDRTLYFDLTAELARKRGHSGSRQQSGRADRLDAESLAFYARVRSGYRALAEAEPERFRVIDSSAAKEATEAAVRAALADLVAASAEAR